MAYTKIRKALCLTLVAALVACVDPVSIEGDPSTPKVVIDAYFTTDSLFNTVRISSSATFSNAYPFVAFNAPVPKAVVRIYDSADNLAASFEEKEPGLHVTTSAAIPNNSYYLDVTLPDGAHYRSEIVQTRPAAEMNPLTFNISQETTLEENSGSFLELKSYYFNVQASTKDPGPQADYFLWRAYGTFEYMTRPIGDAPCLYCYCWASEYPLLSYIPVMSDKEVMNGIIHKKIASIKYDRGTLYQIKAYQFSITADAFKYWNSISQQQSLAGTIFDPTPQQIKGNIKRVDDLSETVLGYFTTAGVSFQKIMIDRGREAKKNNLVDPNLKELSSGDCRQLYKIATHIKPADFHE